jgi:hypothetical protein
MGSETSDIVHRDDLVTLSKVLLPTQGASPIFRRIARLSDGIPGFGPVTLHATSRTNSPPNVLITDIDDLKAKRPAVEPAQFEPNDQCHPRIDSQRPP